MDDNFATNLLRAIAAQLALQNTMTASRELFDKSYFSLGLTEKIAVDQAVLGHLQLLYGQLTPDYLASPPPTNPVGFGTSHSTSSTPAGSQPATGTDSVPVPPTKP